MARSKLFKKTFKAITFIIILAILVIAGPSLIIPDISGLEKEKPGKTSFMKYREEEWKRQGRKMTIQQIWTPLTRISPYLTKAVLIAEDDKFFMHEGFDYDSIEKALEKDIEQKKFKFGGSTISQQLAKNLYLSPSKNPLRKFREAILTWKLERTLSKKRILEIYLNVAEWGEGIFGIEAASLHYYGKHSSDLTPEEASRLASVLPNPKKYSPTGRSRYVEKRSKIIYSIMVKRGIVKEEYDLDE